ncbi:hypothetical protein CVU82_02985 [Candidatus Falkowbacteria bacterium HGW-Falkowbacteria-1]|jgi:sugar/nucleoside kinase (ribokinase family)|uniref:Carbohydrate kinase PfkB domain-containing protein n=1 Tax=Candidatus Falkowbacteria bacterium HGW-Falkowbacteria-1 TaxID=2013768 RepID=A0A2N2E9W7_9BACT|nr:MAG: hypothetical protein CVU82_02985 [Candidatus Falkowbacteria bacterium HGW-Falkowbacteria-1]
MKKFDFITIGGATEDIVFYTKDGVLLKNKKDLLKQELLAFEQGAKIKVEKSFNLFGGGAANVAVNLSNLCFNVASMVNLGDDDRGLKILENFKKNKVDNSLLSIDKKIGSGFSFVLNNGKDRIIFTYRGSNDNLTIDNKKTEKLKNTDRIYLTSLPKNWLKFLNKVFSLDKKVYWNPGLQEISHGSDRIAKFINKTEILMLNRDEALELVRKSKGFKKYNNKYLSNIDNLLKLIKGLGPKNLVITDGLEGAYFFDGSNFYHQKVVREKKHLDTTGVGDAFNSTFSAFFILFEGDYKKAMNLAAKNAASVISSYGAQNGLLNINNLLK